MRLLIDHVTEFQYDDVVSEAYTEVRLRPLDEAGQRCLSFTLSTEPHAEVSQYRDHAGNDVRFFDMLPPHQRLVLTTVSEVMTPDSFAGDERGLSLLEGLDYRASSAYTGVGEWLKPLTDHIAGGVDGYGMAWAMMGMVHDALKYERGVTDVGTTAEQAWALGRGVCQDFAHVMIAACRASGLAARYVSGYLYSSRAGDAHQATHAWVDVFVEGRGWISLDPTHNTPQNAHYVRVAVGRDYADVPPTRGVYTGTAAEHLHVQVRVRAG